MDAPRPSRASGDTAFPADAGPRSLAVAEFAGLDGPFVFAERLLQRIWAERGYDPAQLRTMDGRAVTVRHPGRWNRLGGPDFLGARLRLGEESVEGDVELHLRAGDWAAHGHGSDPAYAGVVLHVVLLPPERATTRGVGGRELPVVALLPALLHDLEEYAADDAVERLAGRSTRLAGEQLAALPPAEMRAGLRTFALRRWSQKVGFARRRITRLGWAGACHATALEILGYRANRAAMLNVAARWSLADWAGGRVSPAEAWASGGEGWVVQGVRPANHPRARLGQYAAWVAAVPDWPERLARLAPPSSGAAPELLQPTAEWRRAMGWTRWLEQEGRNCVAAQVGGSRVDNLWVDGFFPLLAARDAAEAGEARSLATAAPSSPVAHVSSRLGGESPAQLRREALTAPAWQAAWWHARPGDLPATLPGVLRTLGLADGRAQPLCTGWAQGLLGWLIERELVHEMGPA